MDFMNSVRRGTPSQKPGVGRLASRQGLRKRAFLNRSPSPSARDWRATASFTQPSLSVSRPYSCPSATLCLVVATSPGPYLRTTRYPATASPTINTASTKPPISSTFIQVGTGTSLGVMSDE